MTLYDQSNFMLAFRFYFFCPHAALAFTRSLGVGYW